MNWELRKEEIRLTFCDMVYDDKYLDKIISQEQSMIKETLEKFADKIYNINPFNDGRQEGYAVITFTNLKKEIKKIIKDISK